LMVTFMGAESVPVLHDRTKAKFFQATCSATGSSTESLVHSGDA
jgi:hypothetical protein